MRISDWSSDVCSSDLFEFGQRLAEQVAGGIAAAGVVVLPFVVEACEAEVARQHQRRGDRTEGRVAVDAGAHGAGGGAATGAVGRSVVEAHAMSPLPRSALARMASMRSVSLRKASCP